MAEIKKPPVRSAKPARVALNSTFSGRAASASADVPRTAVKDVRTRKLSGMRPLNSTLASDQSFAVSTASGVERDCEFKLEYNKLLQSILMECTLQETRETEQTELDAALAQLAERCERSVELLEKSHERLAEISFLCEKQRIVEMKSTDCSEFYARSQGGAATALEELARRQGACADRCDTRAVDLGYNERSGHRQLLDALEDALQGFENIRNQSKLSPEVLDQFQESNRGLKRVQQEATDLQQLREEFQRKFPELGERALILSSDELARRVDEHLGLNGSDAEEEM